MSLLIIGSSNPSLHGAIIAPCKDGSGSLADCCCFLEIDTSTVSRKKKPQIWPRKSISSKKKSVFRCLWPCAIN